MEDILSFMSTMLMVAAVAIVTVWKPAQLSPYGKQIAQTR